MYKENYDNGDKTGEKMVQQVTRAYYAIFAKVIVSFCPKILARK